MIPPCIIRVEHALYGLFMSITWISAVADSQMAIEGGAESVGVVLGIQGYGRQVSLGIPGEIGPLSWCHSMVLLPAVNNACGSL